MLYSKNGSIPKTETDGTEGWVEVPEPPVAGEGQEVVWWCPPGWVVRPVMPVKEGFQYSWSQSQEMWMEFPADPVETPVEPDLTLPSASTGEVISGATADVVIDLGSAGAV